MDFIITSKGILTLPELNVLLFSSDRSAYEVIRVIDGIALFLEDHFERLTTSVNISGLCLEMEFSEFRQKIDELIVLNQTFTGNVKFVLTMIEEQIHWQFSFIPPVYPGLNDYRYGVATGLFFAERENPNAKIIQNSIRDAANQMIADDKLYEVLLVDRKGLITEGSRSNVFFVKDKFFFTAPVSQVLVGITRQKVLECLNELSYSYIEEAVAVSELNDFEAVFLTGTSPKVLPVNSIGTNKFAVNNHLVEQLMVKYDSMIKQYIDERIK